MPLTINEDNVKVIVTNNDSLFGLKDNNCPLAQLVEQMTVNHLVRGSSPRGAAILTKY